MNIIDINTVDKPLDPNAFNVIEDSAYPYFILGFQIKNEYDRLRHCIPAKYNPIDIVHFCHYPEIAPYFFRGIKLTPSNKMLQLYTKLTEGDKLLLNDFDRSIYNQILQDGGVSADYCSQYLRMGIYPIDGCHSDKLDCSVNLNNLYEDIFQDKNIPYFQSIGYIVLYILDNKNCANSNNAKAIKNLVKRSKN